MESASFYIALFVHLMSLVIGFGSVIVIDTFGLLWLLKRVELKLVVKIAETTQKLIWLGWLGLVLSGVVLISSKGYIDGLTWIKLFFVVLIGLNGYYLHRLKKVYEKAAETNHVTAYNKFRIGFASLVSQLGWWGTIFIGFVHRHIEHNVAWPKHPILVMVIITLGLAIIYLAGDSKFRRRA